MKYELIVAVGNNNEIGYRGKLLWSIPEDMEFFQSVTIGNTVVMGRKTWESLPKKYRPCTYFYKIKSDSCSSLYCATIKGIYK